MQTLKEKITFTLTALAYLLFHVRTGPSLGAIVAGTVEQLLTTAPYCIGFTWVLVVLIRHLSGGRRPPWDRIARIFFTIGIFFAFYFALYEYGERAQQDQDRSRDDHPSVSLILPDDTRMAPLYWA